MHVDAMTTPQPLGRVGDLARHVQTAGFSGMLFTEMARTAYLGAAVASQAAPGLELSTGVAVAVPRERARAEKHHEAENHEARDGQQE